MIKKLALLGGEKSVDIDSKTITAPIVAEAAYETVNRLMRDGEISTSPIVKKFEEKFSEFIGTNYALTVTNGTTSIQCALFAVGVGAGDEVIVPSYTFWASVGPVIASNAIPVFADVDLELQTLTAQTIEKCITSRTKAIVVVHTWGTPCDMEPIMELARKHNIKVVEDCSHAHGAEYHGKKVGSIGDIGCFSMQGSKVLAAGEGGILVTNNREYLERACALGHYERLGLLSDDSEYKKYALTGFGYKHRMHPLAVAIADAGLDRLDELNSIRLENAQYFESLISDISFIKQQKVPRNSTRVYAYHYARYLSEENGGLALFTLLKALSAEGVCCGSCGYGKLHKAPLYNEETPFGHGCPLKCPNYRGEYHTPTCLPNTEMLADSTFMLAPRFETKSKEAIEQYSEAYHKIEQNIDSLLQYEKENNLSALKILNDGRSINLIK